MRDTELYRQLLGLEPPWEVNRVELSTELIVRESTAPPGPARS